MVACVMNIRECDFCGEPVAVALWFDRDDDRCGPCRTLVQDFPGLYTQSEGE